MGDGGKWVALAFKKSCTSLDNSNRERQFRSKNIDKNGADGIIVALDIQHRSKGVR